jgi:hypothetical protein
MNTEQFFNACKNFDWYYDFSDDSRVWRNGTAAKEKLLNEAKSDPIKMKIFTDWNKHMFSGESWSTPRTIKPELEHYHD